VIVIIRVKPSEAANWLIRAEKHFGRFLNLTRMSLMRTIGVAAAGCALYVPTADFAGPLPADRMVQPDPRALRLEAFFRHYHCPSPHYVSEYLRVTDSYGLDYRLLPAISIRETQCGVESAEMNNHWGYHPGRQTFPSIEAGIDFVARQLAEGPVYKDKSLHDKLFTYNPLPAYPDEVKRIMRQIESVQLE
jgi:hypothetical protein